MFFKIPLIFFQSDAHRLEGVFPEHLQGWGKCTVELYISYREMFYTELEDQVETQNQLLAGKVAMHEELALAPEESTTPFLLTPNSIDLSCEHLFTMVETPTHTTNFSLCSYKKALCSVIHLWEKGHGEEAQITLDSLHKEFQGLVCPDHGLEVGVCFWLVVSPRSLRFLTLWEGHGWRRGRVDDL